MSDFPTIYPSSIQFNHGSAQISEYNQFGVGPIRFRNSKFINGQKFTIQYIGIQQAQVDLIRTHYNENHGTAGQFAVPLAILGNVNVFDSTSNFRYADTPTEEHFGIYFNVTVELVALKGLELLFRLNGGPATLPAEESFTKYVFDGTAPFILNGSSSTLATLICNAD
jgi:hypothetical protein|tara:strand:- start:1930 stop:2433 length:504 start_codon:yes stop_codon:yes gene_type:complete